MFSCPDASLNMFIKQQVSSVLWTRVSSSELSLNMFNTQQVSSVLWRQVSSSQSYHSTCSTNIRSVQSFKHMFNKQQVSSVLWTRVSSSELLLNMYNKQQVSSVFWTYVSSSHSYHSTCSTNNRSVQSFEHMFPALRIIAKHVQHTGGQFIPLNICFQLRVITEHWTCSTNNRSVQSFERMIPAQSYHWTMNMFNKQQVSSVLWRHVSSSQSYHSTCSTNKQVSPVL